MASDGVDCAGVVVVREVRAPIIDSIKHGFDPNQAVVLAFQMSAGTRPSPLFRCFAQKYGDSLLNSKISKLSPYFLKASGLFSRTETVLAPRLNESSRNLKIRK